MCTTDCSDQLTLWKVGTQQVTVDFEGGAVVSEAGLLAVRQLERGLGILAEVAQRLPDPRTQELVTHSTERILTQQVYQILAGYFDCNDAGDLRDSPLFQTLADRSPSDGQPLASGSTLARYQHAYTRRDAELPPEERPVLQERRAAQVDRIKILNAYLPELFIRTRPQAPTRVIIDLDATDDPTHGQQQLTFFNGYYDQYQYLPLLAFDGESGFPLAAWLRPGKAHASWGAVEAVRRIVQTLRQAWPDVVIVVRGDTGFAVPELYEFCEAEGLLYAFGYASNAVLKRRTELKLRYVEAVQELYEEKVQLFDSFTDYQAEGWSRPRRIIAKIEAMPQGTNRRFVVTNLTGTPQEVYHGFYVQRGNVPEKPIGELKNGLAADRLSSERFLANALRLQYHVLAYAIVVLFREANQSVPEVATQEVGTLRQQVFQAGAVVTTSVRRIWFHFSSSWPRRELFVRICRSIAAYLDRLSQTTTDPPVLTAALLK